MAQQKSTVDVKVWKAPDLGAELLKGRFADFSYDVHTHDTACFALLTRGAIRIRMHGSEFVARKGDLYAVDADVPHAGWPTSDEEGWSLRTFYVDMAHLRSIAGYEKSGGGVSLKGPIIHDDGLKALLYGVHHCSEANGPSLYREEQYLAFAARLFQRHARTTPLPVKAGKEDRAVRLAKDFLDHHLRDQVHLGEIADVAGLPPYRLLRAFERTMGMSPHSYQRQARIRWAIDLLRLNHDLSEVAATTGFSDQAHLTRWFRRVMGVTPGLYRQAVSMRPGKFK
jgi:AraC-like DNA-binding protein